VLYSLALPGEHSQTLSTGGSRTYSLGAVVLGGGHWTETTTGFLLWTILQYHCI